jgi:hypothetical protein
MPTLMLTKRIADLIKHEARQGANLAASAQTD